MTRHTTNLAGMLTITVAIAIAAGCGGADEPAAPAPVTLESRPFGTTPEGTTVELFTLKNANGVEVSISTLGATIVSIRTPDRQGRSGDIVLGFDSLDGYLANGPYFGALVGRYANRIALGRFTLDDATYTLATNNAPNHLHGGVKGFDKVVWTPETTPAAGGPAVRLRYLSVDGEEGYPGNLTTTVTYTLGNDNALTIAYSATTDKATVVNLSNHSYFNLAGTGDILGHQLQIHADNFTPVTSSLIPTGELAPVEGTPFDFRQPTAIGARIDADNEQIRFGGGYDHNFVLSSLGAPGQPAVAARVVDPVSGRTLEVRTTEPGVQFYTGNFLDGSVTGKGGTAYARRSGFCLETQHFPDSPNQPSFPSTVLRPGETFESTTVFAFGVE